LWLSHKCYYNHSSSSLFVLHTLPISTSLTCNPNYTWRRVQIMKLTFMQFSPPSRHFIPLRSKYSPELSVLKLPQSMFLP
jgi:hypothetical protein